MVRGKLQLKHTLLSTLKQWHWKNYVSYLVLNVFCISIFCILGACFTIFAFLKTSNTPQSTNVFSSISQYDNYQHNPEITYLVHRMYMKPVETNDVATNYPDLTNNENSNKRISSNQIIVCYYTIPTSLNSSREPSPSDLDPHICTHIIVGFAKVANSVINLEGASWIYETIAQFKNQEMGLNVMLSVGDMNDIEGEFSKMVKTRATRKRFIKSVLNVTKILNLDGLDIDWEFPAWTDADDKQKVYFAQLLQELRKEFNRSKPQLLLSIAVAAPVAIIDESYNISEIAKHVDFVCLMSYDYHFYVWYFPITGHNAPLYPRDTEIGYARTLNVNYSAMHWLTKGMPLEKLIIGIPTYGHSYKLYNPLNHGLLAPARNVGELGLSGFVSYADACGFLKYGAIRHFDSQSKVPYAYKNDEWISFEDEASVQWKAEYIKTHGFGGAMIFSLNVDDWDGRCFGTQTNKTYPLTRTINKILRGSRFN